MTELMHLNDNVLLHIFDRADNATLQSLRYVCSRFLQLIDRYVLPKRCQDLLMTGTRKAATDHQKRTHHRPSALGRLRIHNGWLSGRYREHTLYQHRIMYPSAIHLERDTFYMSHRAEIRRHRRKRDGLPEARASRTYGRPSQTDVTCFRLRGSVLFGGRHSGDYFLYDNADDDESDVCDEARTLGADGAAATLRLPVVAVDMLADCYVTANRQRLTVWRRVEELGRAALEPQADYDEDYKSVGLQPDGEWLAAGKYRDPTRAALELIHLERGTRHALNSRSTSVYDLRWLDANVLLTANYDSTCRLHDVRCNRDVLSWMDPYDAAVYTLQTDGLYAVLAGMSANCRVNLYDVRMSHSFVQMFYPRMEHNARGSPVYGLACDATQLYVATDHNLRVMDFTAYWAPERDYRNVFVQRVVVRADDWRV